jgi:hypothetical protein
VGWLSIKGDLSLEEGFSGHNPDGTPACEQVALIESILGRNGKLFIFPQFLVRTPTSTFTTLKIKLLRRLCPRIFKGMGVEFEAAL